MKLNGYRPSHKNRWLLLKAGIISREGLLFWEYCLDQMQFDKRNPGYGTATVNFEEVMEYFHIKSPTTVRNWHNELTTKGFVREIDKRKHILEIINCERYIEGINGRVDEYAKKEKDQSIDQIKQSIGLNDQYVDENNQSIDQNNADLGTKVDTKALSSFKVDLSSQHVRTMEEYREIHDRGNWGPYTAEDMMWVDQYQGNCLPVVTKDEKSIDQDLVDTFFSGDTDSYMSHLIT